MDALDALAGTARWTVAARARESARPDRLFDDPLAATLAGDVGFALLDAEPAEAQGNPYLPIRTRFFDDWLEGVTAHDGLRQVVLLAAGMDTRAFRLAWPPGVTLWELDRPALLDLKEELLAAAGATPACQRRVLGVDLAQDDWPGHLRAAGFDATGPSAWLAEGVLQYLDAAAVERLLATLATVAAPGSRLGADFLSRDFLTSAWMAAYLRLLEQRGTPWCFGTNEPEALLARYGWRVEAVTQPGEEGAAFGRWPWPVAPRDLPGFPRSFLVSAQRPAPAEADVRARDAGDAAGEERAARAPTTAFTTTALPQPPTAAVSAVAAAAAPQAPPQMTFTDYDARYPRAVAQLAQRVCRALPAVQVEHVGSTAVPGLGGRRVLDVVIPALPEEHAQIRAVLLGLGFTDFPYAHIRPLLQGAVQYAGEDYPVLLYLLPPDHPYLRGWIASRDYLRAHPDEARRYAEVKRQALAAGHTAPWSYQQAKTPYLEDLVRRIAADAD